MKAFFISLFFFSAFSHFIFGQLLPEKKIHPFANPFAATLEAGGTIPKTDYRIDELSISGRLSLEYFFKLSASSALALRMAGSGGVLKGQVFSNDAIYPPVSETFSTDFFTLGSGVMYALSLGSTVPYFSASIAYIHFNPLDENGYKLPNNKFSVYDKGAALYNFEGGIRFPFAGMWSLNIAADYNFSSTDYLDDVTAGYSNDAFFGFYTGVSFYFGKETDTDDDGIPDDYDLCPGSPEGAEVNQFGCSTEELNSKDVVYDTLNDHFVLDGIFSDGKLYCVQIDIFRDTESAETLQNKIISLGYKAAIIRIKFGGRIWYSVRIGYFNSFDNAKYFQDNFFKTTKIKLN